MKMKRLSAWILTAVMSMSVLAGCGDGSTNTTSGTNSSTATEGVASGEVEQVNLKVWVPEEDVEFTQAQCEKFDEEHPEFECTFEVAVVGIDESVNALEADADTAADVFTLPSGSISQLAEAGLIYPITANIDDVKSMYPDSALAAATRQDMLYGIPFSPNTWFMYYDKSLYTEDEVKNLDTMMAKDLGADVYNFSCVIHDSWYIEAFFYAAGCTLYGADGTDPKDCTWNSDAGVAAGNYLIDLVNNPKYIEDKDSIALSLMKEGKLGACCTGTWGAPDIKEALGENYAACALPTITIDGKECQLSNFADYKCFGVKSNTAHPLAAQLLAEYLCNEESQLLRYQIAGVTPTCLSLEDSEELKNDPAACALMAQSAYTTPQPSISQISNYWTPVAALGDGIVNGDITSENIKEKLDVVVTDVTTNLAE